jgi:hypothetical protein
MHTVHQYKSQCHIVSGLLTLIAKTQLAVAQERYIQIQRAQNVQIITKSRFCFSDYLFGFDIHLFEMQIHHFVIVLPNPSGRIGPGVYSASNRNEYQKHKNNNVSGE